jgi:lysozyme
MTEAPKGKSRKGVGFGLAALLLASPLVMYYEGLELETYVDPVGIPTVCYGETSKDVIDLKSTYTKEECSALLGASMQKHMTELVKCVATPVKTNEAAALISWSYNVGTTAACNSTLMKKLNAGVPAAQWCPELRKWVYAGGTKLNGLVKRRESEYKMCMTGAWK